MLEKIWDEYLFEEYAFVDSMEEKELSKKASEMHNILNALLTEEQNNAMENYIEALYIIQDYRVRKAFIKGCKFTASFLLEAGIC
jgi:hypothetical protein